MRFDQRRTQNVVEAPWIIAQAGYDNMRGRPMPQMILPASMGQNKWKTPGRGYDHGYAASARAVGTLAQSFGTPAPIGLMEPVALYPQSRAARNLNRLPGMRTVVSVQQPLSRGVLQRGDTDITNAEDVRAVARFRNNPPEAYGVQENIHAQMFPSNYVFSKHHGPRYVTPAPGVSGIVVRGRRR